MSTDSRSPVIHETSAYARGMGLRARSWRTPTASASASPFRSLLPSHHLHLKFPNLVAKNPQLRALRSMGNFIQRWNQVKSGPKLLSKLGQFFKRHSTS